MCAVRVLRPCVTLPPLPRPPLPLCADRAFPSDDALNKVIIYNYAPAFTGLGASPGFEQCYFFD
ncbi:hypothetical protein EON62_04360 [archaeon]|nr:MAG: hypothetical protein EON62_04360 [archaeon]